MESVDRFAETAKIRGTKGSNLVSGTIISVAREARRTNTRISLLKHAAPLRMPAAKIRRNDAEIFDLPSPTSNICSRTRCRSWLNQRKKEFSLLFNHFSKNRSKFSQPNPDSIDKCNRIMLDLGGCLYFNYYRILVFSILKFVDQRL